MTTAPPSPEDRRLAALRSYGVIDSPQEQVFDHLTAMACELFETPIAMVSLVEQDRVWFKSRIGLEPESFPSQGTFCRHAIDTEQDLFVVEDASLDPRFSAHPTVVSGPMVRFYAGAMLRGREGEMLGALCVLDSMPRKTPSAGDLKRLSMLARIAVDEMDLRRQSRLNAEKAALLNLVETTADIGHWRYDKAANKVDWSDQIYRIFGVDRASFDTDLMNALTYLHPDDRDEVRHAIGEALSTRSGCDYEARVLRPDGETRHIACRAICELDAAGELSALFGVCQDITKPVEVLREVRRSERRYRLLADNMGDVVTRIRFDGTSHYISPAIEQLIGFTPQEMLGFQAQDFVLEEDRPLLLKAFATLQRGEQRASAQIRALHKDGSTVWAETTFRLVRDETGTPREMVAVIRDIHERKVLEALAAEAKADAERAAAVKSDFLANMSHELRTPLTAVLGFARLIDQQPELSERTRHYISRVVSGGNALLATVNDILDFSRLEAGQVEIRTRATPACEIAHAALHLFDAQADAKGLALEVQGLEALPRFLLIDPDRVRQVMLNLIGNAVKFTESGAVALRLTFDERRQILRARVEDTGPGIPADEAQRLFQRFSQVDGSSTRRHGGTGLGLAISKGLVEAMGGEIGVDSHVGVGTTFWFEIPTRVVDALSAEAFEEAESLEAGVRVLVADDNPVNRDLVHTVLAAVGAEVTQACDGLQAVAAAQSAPFDVILMDLRMPGLDGAGAAMRIRTEPGPNSSTPIIAFSADVSVALEPGLFDGRVGKPASAETLIGALAQALDPDAHEAVHVAA